MTAPAARVAAQATPGLTLDTGPGESGQLIIALPQIPPAADWSPPTIAMLAAVLGVGFALVCAVRALNRLARAAHAIAAAIWDVETAIRECEGGPPDDPRDAEGSRADPVLTVIGRDAA